MKLQLILAVALVGALLGAGSATADTSSGTRFDFEVFLDDMPIGAHRFEVETRGEQQVVVSQADFEVKALLFTIYTYRHRNREVWQGRCLRTIDAHTDSNGDESKVQGETSGDGFLIRTADSSSRLEPCVRSFAYWDRTLLDQGRLLNSQTGEHVPVAMRLLGTGTLTIGDQDVPVRRFALKGDGVDIVLSYAVDTDEWVGLDSRLDSGRMLSYRRRSAETGAPQPEAASRERGGEA